VTSAKVVVIDASVAFALIASEQTTPATTAFLESVDAIELRAPAIFAWEIGNQCLRRSRRTGFSHVRMLNALAALRIVYAPGGDAERVLALIELAAASGLSLFDAAYLALALDLDAPLATRDAGLVRASALAGAPCLDLR
jgi:predicted nucleic acid-binding protein